ncbi:indeterminate-domain [Thalictrum thalictroides]|uniref:Indeterminate-domain n=1 Tax=Thalictrum thalictroides TaxID=46969 RepID=A0A7J6VNT2_THATH|nr:indeterminate-domain [Thalictrum thalictroides]
MSNITGDSRSFSSGNTGEEEVQQQHQKLQNHFHGLTKTINSNGSTSEPPLPPLKKKRNLPGTPDPSAEVIALSPTTLMATNRFICEICNKGFQRDQNLQLHRRGHNLPWKLKQRTSTEIRKRVYICPETSCVHHNPARALGDLTGIKKHFCRKHGEKKWKCDKCSKKYAVQSDWKAHSKTCGTREYKCDCGTIFSRRDSFITHRAFCDALAEENNKVNQGLIPPLSTANLQGQVPDFLSPMPPSTSSTLGISEFHQTDQKNPLKSLPHDLMPMPLKSLNMAGGMFSSSTGTLYNGLRSMSSTASCLQLSPNTSSSFDGLHNSKTSRQISGSAHMSATALLQKAAQMGATASSNINSPMMQKSFVTSMTSPDQISGMRPSTFGGIMDSSMQQHSNNSYDHMQSQQTDQTQLVGNDGGAFINQFLHNNIKDPKDMAPQFMDTPVGAENDMGVYSGLFMSGGEGSDQHHGFSKNMGHENGSMFQGKSSSTGVGIPGSGRNTTGLSRFSGNGGGDVMTVDFLGVGGSRSANFHEQHHQPRHHQDQQQEEQESLDFEGMSEHRMQGLHSYHQQVSQGQATMEKPIWEV